MVVLEWLRSSALTLFDVDVSWAELIGDLTGLVCVWWVARQRLASWPMGLINNVMWALLFVDARLYADATLQCVFFVLGIYGWWIWARGAHVGEAGATKLRVRRTRRAEWLALAVGTGAGMAVVAAVLARWSDSPAPIADASVLALSLAATWGQAQKLLESWWIWIVVDVVSVPLYLSRGLVPTALVYAIFLVLCVKGLRDWTRALEAR